MRLRGLTGNRRRGSRRLPRGARGGKAKVRGGSGLGRGKGEVLLRPFCDGMEERACRGGGGFVTSQTRRFTVMNVFPTSSSISRPCACRAAAPPAFCPFAPPPGSAASGWGVFGWGRPNSGEDAQTFGGDRPNPGDGRPTFGGARPISGEARPTFGDAPPNLGETRPTFEYRAIYRVADARAGQWSLEVAIAVGG